MDNLQPDTENTITETHPAKPFLLRLIGVSSMVMGIVGMLFFSSVIFYLLIDKEFSLQFARTYFTIETFWFYLAIGFGLHILLMLSGFLLFRLKKTGLWIFLGATAGLLVFAKIVDNNLFLSEILVFLLLLIILIAYRKKLN
ncbi:MAG: hypothetical protein Q8O72_16600 [Bacteroidales bacterium]|nr:hypothetical protein [Bacteroidales bacterium]